MRHYYVKDEDDLIKQIELDDEPSKEFEDAELVDSRVKRSDLDFECTPHMFRHSRARRLVTLGIELPTIQRFMRHKNLTTTQQYVTAVEDDILNMRETVRNSKPPPS